MEKVKANLEHVCVFCCKLIHERNFSAQPEIRNLHNFLAQFHRYLGTKRNSFGDILGLQSPGEKGRYLVCGNCMPVITSFCDMYHETKCLELKTRWKVETLLSVMKQANRVPSRMELARNAFGECQKLEDYSKLLIARKRFIKSCMLAKQVHAFYFYKF